MGTILKRRYRTSLNIDGSPGTRKIRPASDKINVLVIGSDPGLRGGASDPTMKRQMAYARHCGYFIFLCYTGPGFKPISMGSHFHVYPTNSRSRWRFFQDGLRIGLRIMKQYPVNVVVTQDTFIFGALGLILKWLTKIGLAVHYHSGFWTNPYWLKERKINRLLAFSGRFVSRHADVIRTVSSDIERDLLSRGFPSRRVHYATPPVDAEGFLRPEPEKEDAVIARYGLNPMRTFLFIGRFSREKNLPMLLRAVKRVSMKYPDLKVMMIGRGPEEGRLRDLAAELGISGRVVFTGAVANDELKHYLRTGISLLISSYYEGTAKVIKEAALSERTTITTDTSGVRDAMRQDLTGLVVPIGDEDAFVEAMERLLEDPERAMNMGREARSFVLERFDYYRDVERIVRVWERAAAGRGRSALLSWLNRET